MGGMLHKQNGMTLRPMSNFGARVSLFLRCFLRANPDSVSPRVRTNHEAIAKKIQKPCQDEESYRLPHDITCESTCLRAAGVPRFIQGFSQDLHLGGELPKRTNTCTTSTTAEDLWHGDLHQAGASLCAHHTSLRTRSEIAVR